MSIISQILSLDINKGQFTKYLKLEATWILTNLAYGEEQDLLLLLDSKFGITDKINIILEGNDL